MSAAMSRTTAIAMFFLIWWVVLFAVLPWGVRSQHEGGDVAPGTDPGAPVLPKLGRKLIWTTLVAGLVFAVLYVAYTDRLVSLNGFLAPLGPHFTE
jgi:predicted secreted protein